MRSLAGAITDHIEKPHDGLVAQFGLLSFDLPQLRRNVEEALRTREQVTLSDLLAIYPPHDGVFDLLGYVAVATESGHLIDSDSIATFPLAAREPGGSRRIVRFPEVYFVRKT